MQQQVLQAPVPKNNRRQRRAAHRRQQQQQQQGRELAHAPLLADERAYAMAALDLEACLPQGGERNLAAAHATVQELVQLLCPSLDALLALTRETAGHLAQVSYGPTEPPRPHWQSELVPEIDVHESQLLTPSGTKVAMQGVALPSLKAVCTQALAEASSSGGGGVRAFFWTVQQQLKAELQQGATAQQDSQEQAAEVLSKAQQDSQEQAGEVLRSCVLSCAHVARCLVTIHNLLVTAGQAQQQHDHQAAAAAAPQARPLVRALCPALDALLALSPKTAPPLHNLPFMHVDETDGVGWECRLNHQPVPSLQLQSVAGIMRALENITYASFKLDVVRVLNSTAATAEDAQPAGAAATAAAAGGQAGNNAGLRGFFWGVHALLCTQVENGVTARQGSKAQATQGFDEYVHSVAHVANLLLALYNLLLRGGQPARGAGRQRQQQRQQSTRAGGVIM